MSGIRRRIAQKKQDSRIYYSSIVEDQYGGEKYVYSPSDEVVHVLWTPLSSEVEIAEYGERVNEMLQAVLYDNVTIKENDRVEVNGNMYNVVSLKPYPSYRLVIAERVK